MRVLVATHHPSGSNVAYRKLLACLEGAAASPDGDTFCLNPAEADAVLFVENDYLGLHNFVSRLLAHPLHRRFAGRCYLFSNTDWGVPYLPGIFTSLTPHTFVPGRSIASHYVDETIPRIPQSYIEEPRRDWLYSFMGRTATSPVRRQLLQLHGGRGHCLDVSVAPHSENKHEDYRSAYWSVTARSHFVLCPRGYGSSSMRLFEVMQSGRVPIIVSDDWIAPEGPDWPAFSIRIAESRIAEIPKILAGLEPHSADMGAAARRAWLQWFSDENTPRTLLGHLRRLSRNRQGGLADRAGDMAWSLRFLAAPGQLRWFARRMLDRLQGRIV